MSFFVIVDAVEAIAEALATKQVRYLVVGGMAMNAYGGERVTFDVDLVLQLQPENILRAFEALADVGYRPSVPITAAQFVQPGLRERWRDEKSMVVLNFWAERYPETRLGVFVYEPFDFDREYANALCETLLPGIELRYAGVETLIAMKRAAGRPKDLQDVEFLERHCR